EKDPDRRWQTADELLRVLEGIRSTDPHLTVSREIARPEPPRSLRPAGLAMLGVAALVAGWFLLRPSPPVPARVRNSVLVLPPTVRGDSVLQQHGDVFQSDLTHDLQRLGLNALDPHATDGMEHLTQHEIGARLGVAYLVTSSVATMAEGARLILNLVDQDFNPLWTESYRLPLEEQGAWDSLVDSVAVLLAARLPAGVRAAAAGQIREQRSRTPMVAGLVENAEKALRSRTRDGVLECIALLRQAIAEDPEDARAHATLSSAYALLTVYYYRTDLDPYAAAARSLAHADLAVALDPNSDEGFVARGYILWQVNAPIDTVRAQFEAARRLNPSVQPGWYSIMLMRENLRDSALAEARRGVELDPLSPSRRINIAWDALGLRQDSLAVHEADSAFALEPDLDFTRGLLMHSLLAAGQRSRCVRMEAGPYLGARAACLDGAGRTAEARATVDSLLASFMTADRASTFSSAIFAQEMAIYFAARGERQASMLWIREAFRQAPNGMQWVVLRSRLFEGMLADPALAAEIRAIETAAYPRVAEGARRYLTTLSSATAS
ncbi:MAG: Adenylate cyclase, partial [Gemmatimonadetes bacterium]|nr:Adenylate cyclase [Gemmatimonadota bacterium]